MRLSAPSQREKKGNRKIVKTHEEATLKIPMRTAQKSFFRSPLLRAKCITNYIKFKPLPHLTLLCIGYDIVIAAVNFSV